MTMTAQHHNECKMNLLLFIEEERRGGARLSSSFVNDFSEAWFATDLPKSSVREFAVYKALCFINVARLIELLFVNCHSLTVCHERRLYHFCFIIQSMSKMKLRGLGPGHTTEYWVTPADRVFILELF